MQLEHFRSRRRTVIVGAGLGAITAVLAACSTYGKKPAAEGATSAPAESAPAEASGPAAPPSTPDALAKTADVPVGSGVIVDDLVLTQPSAGVFKGFSAVCTHAGCTVSEVVDGTIICPCHGSQFKLDGSVAKGPATTPLESKAVTVEGDSIVAG